MEYPLIQVYFNRRKLTSLLLVDVFAEVAQVNAEALNIKPYQPGQNNYRESAEAKCIFI